MQPSSLLPPPSVLALQITAALVWVGGYIAWSRAYYLVLDPRLRRVVGTWVRGDVIWVYRVGSFHTGALSFTRISSWSWGLAGERTETTIRDAARTTLRDYTVYASFVILVPALAGLWPIALLLYLGLWRHALAVVVLLPLLFLVGPLYVANWTLQSRSRPPRGVPKGAGEIMPQEPVRQRFARCVQREMREAVLRLCHDRPKQGECEAA
jgi:hypothetical protein